MDSRSYQPNSGNTMILNQPSIPHGVILRDKNLQGHQGQPQYHHNQVIQGHHQNHMTGVQHYQGQQSRAPPMTRFYNQEEMMTSPADFPAPPELMLQGARHNHQANGY